MATKIEKKSERKNSGKMAAGVILIALGLMFLLDNYGFYMFDIGRLWPLFLIIPGIFLLKDYNKKS